MVTCKHCGQEITWEMGFSGYDTEWAWRHTHGTPTRSGNLPRRCYGYPSEIEAEPGDD